MGDVSPVNLALALAMFALVLVVARRSWASAVAVTVFGMVLGSCSFWEVQSRFLTARWGGLAALLLTIAWRAQLPRLDRSAIGRWQILAGVIAGLAIVSAAWSIDSALTIQRAVAFSSLLAVAFVLVWQKVSESSVADALVEALAMIGVVLTVTALIGLAVAPERTVFANNLRGIMGSPNQLGLLLAITWPLLAVTLERRGVRWLGTAGSLAVVAAVVALSTSRSGLLALFVAILLVEGGRRRWAQTAAQIAITLAVSVAIVSVDPTLVDPASDPAGKELSVKVPSDPTGPTPPPVARGQRGEFLGREREPGQSFLNSALGARDEAWEASVRLTQERPATGYGFGTGDLVFDTYPGKTKFRYFTGVTAVRTNPHNGFLQAFMELGWVGGALFLFPLLAAAVAGTIVVVRGSPQPAALAFGAATIVGLVGAVFESILASTGGAFSLLVWILAAATLRLAPSWR
jgi:hypothetical protein